MTIYNIYFKQFFQEPYLVFKVFITNQAFQITTRFIPLKNIKVMEAGHLD